MGVVMFGYQRPFQEKLFTALKAYLSHCDAVDRVLKLHCPINVHTDEAFFEQMKMRLVNTDPDNPQYLKDCKSGKIVAVLQDDNVDYVFYEDEEVVIITNPDEHHPMDVKKGKMTEMEDFVPLNFIVSLMRALDYKFH